MVNEDKESVVVEALDQTKIDLESGVPSPADELNDVPVVPSVNSVTTEGPVVDPDRDSFFDWIGAFLKPNQPSSPVLPIGDPPTDCPPCG